MLPHYQKAGRAAFVTFCRANRIAFIPEARDAILQHCLRDNGKRYDLHATVVMPDHVHLLLTPLRDEKGWPYSLPTILKQLKGTSARTINKLLNSSGLSDAFDVGVDVAVAPAVDLEVARVVRHSSRTPLTLRLMLLLPLPLILKLRVWVDTLQIRGIRVQKLQR